MARVLGIGPMDQPAIQWTIKKERKMGMKFATTRQGYLSLKFGMIRALEMEWKKNIMRMEIQNDWRATKTIYLMEWKKNII